MSPIDPVTPINPDDQRPPMQSPFLEKDQDMREVEIGLDAAEDEVRDAMDESYEDEAKNSDDPEEALDDVDHDADDGERAPELDAIHDIGRREDA